VTARLQRILIPTLVFPLFIAAVTAKPAKPVKSPVAKVEPREYDFRGATLGMSLQDFRALKFPDANIEPTARLICSSDQEARLAQGGVYLFVDDAEKSIGVIECQYFTPSTVMSGWWDEALVAVGAQGTAKHVDYKFVTDPQSGAVRLYLISLIAYVSARSGAMDGLIGKFGQPTATVNNDVQNRMGAKFDHTLATWVNPSSTILLESPSGDIETMSIIYTENSLLNYVDGAKKRTLGPNSNKM
jgi:hypothetical protein